MALSSFFDNPLLDYFYRPSQIFDQHFGSGLDDDDDFLLAIPSRSRKVLRKILGSPYAYNRNWRSTRASREDKGSTVAFDKDKFQAKLDVQQFSPEEIVVKVTNDNAIVVEGKHEEKEDEHGYVSRQFVRKYVLPEGHDIEKVRSELTTDGVLIITAPKEVPQVEAVKEIPITFTGRPSDAKMTSNKSIKEADKHEMQVDEDTPRRRTKSIKGHK